MTPTIEQAVERIRQVRARFEKRLQPPAGEAAIEKLQKACEIRFGLRVPRQYVHLLQIADGVEDNGVTFYGSTERPFVDSPDSSIAGIVNETAKWWFKQQQLLLGNVEDQLFFYDHIVDEYHVWRISGNEPYRRFKAFAELFAYAFDDDRLFVPDRPPPPNNWASVKSWRLNRDAWSGNTSRAAANATRITVHGERQVSIPTGVTCHAQ